MYNFIMFWLSVGSFLFFSTLSLDCASQEIYLDTAPPQNCLKINFHGHRFLLGPEIAHMRRKNENGTIQNGWLTGARFIYEHRRRYCFYWGVEGSCVRGTMRGHTSKKISLKSRMTDSSIEGRFGYTFKCKSCLKAEFTPFFGAGGLWEYNYFMKPRQLPIHNKIRYSYATVGFLSSISPCEGAAIGLNAKVRYMHNPKCTVSNDPHYPHSSQTLIIGDDHLQYRIELPFSYYSLNCWGVTAIPFYEQRFYGRKAIYPHNFLETRLFDTGLTLGLTYYY